MGIEELVKSSCNFELLTKNESQILSGMVKDSSWFRAVKQKLQPSGINIAKNTVRYIHSEVQAVKMARIIGYSDVQIKELVIALEAKRSELANSLLTDLSLLH